MAMPELAFNVKWNKWRTGHIAWSSATSMRQFINTYSLTHSVELSNRSLPDFTRSSHTFTIWYTCSAQTLSQMPKKQSIWNNFICWYNESRSLVCEYKNTNLRILAYIWIYMIVRNVCTRIVARYSNSTNLRCVDVIKKKIKSNTFEYLWEKEFVWWSTRKMEKKIQLISIFL